MFDSVLFQSLYVWFDIRPFIFDYMDSISEESLFPRVLWMIPDVECIDIPTRLDVGAVDLSTGTVVIKISRIVCGC